MERHDSYQEMRPYTPGAVNSPFPDPTGEGYVGSVRKFAPTATAPANNVKRQPKPRTIRPRQASVRLVRMVIRFRRTMFGVLPLAWRVRAANDPEA